MPTFKETQLDKIVPFLESETHAECTKCGKIVGFYQTDDYDAAEQMKRVGWYATENNLFCPTCQKKRLKSKTKRPIKKK